VDSRGHGLRVGGLPNAAADRYTGGATGNNITDEADGIIGPAFARPAGDDDRHRSGGCDVAEGLDITAVVGLDDGGSRSGDVLRFCCLAGRFQGS
jgi:hypothetical protein